MNRFIFAFSLFLSSIVAHAENFSEYASDPVGLVDDLKDPKLQQPDGTSKLMFYNKPNPKGEGRWRSSEEIARYCNPDGCQGYFVFAVEGDYYQLMTRDKIFGWVKQTEVVNYRTLESTLIGLKTNAQFPIQVWKEAGQGSGEAYVGNQLLVIPENLKFTHSVVIRPKKGLLVNGYPTFSDKAPADKITQIDFVGLEYYNFEAAPGVRAALILELRNDWIKIRMQDHPPYNGKAVWIKRNSPVLGEIKPITSGDLLAILKKAEINVEDLKVPVIAKAVGAKRIGNRLWMDVGFITHEKVTEKDQEKTGCGELRPPYGGPQDPRLKNPGLLKRGWVPLRGESGQTMFDPFQGC